MSDLLYLVLQRQMLSRVAQRAFTNALSKAPRAFFSGGHHVKPYDWRDDHALNPYYEQDPRTLGCQDPSTYSYPHQATSPIYPPQFPPTYNPKDLSQNFVGTGPLLSVAETNLIEIPEQNLWDDIGHEWDYESEDLDFQPETFKSQHFRKKGRIWMWVFIALAPYWYVIDECIYQQWVDGDQFKYQRPPPLNYPDEEDTPDTEAAENWKSPEFIYLWDAGLLRDPFFEIVDGKKIYSKWAGVNAPGVAIK